MMRTALTALLLALLQAVPAAAQVIRGEVLESGSTTPIEGAMVILLAGDGHEAARTLTDTRGLFLFQAEQPGRYRLRIDRIGYESLATDPFDVPREGTFRRIPVAVQPVLLSGIDVEGERRCQAHPAGARGTARVWQEARKALEATEWTRRSGHYDYTLLHFVRHLDREDRTLLHEDRTFVTGRAQAPYVSRSARLLADSGYVVERPDGRLSYFAPDAGVLLSEVFLDTHCFHLESGKDGILGLAFEPLKGRDVAEVSGVLWMDAATDMLTRMEFHYVNTLQGAATAGAGGDVTFARLPAGTWIVRDWHIHMPVFASPGRHAYERVGYQDEGGVVWRVVDDAGAVVEQARAATLAGRVADSLGSAPLPGAVVRVRGLGDQAVSDSTGAFMLSGLPPGRLVLDLYHPSLDTLGLRTLDSTEVSVRAGEVTHLDLRVPGVYGVLSRTCALDDANEHADARSPRGQSAIVLGRVKSAGVPTAGAAVRVRWLSPDPRGLSLDARAAPAGGAGPPPRWRRSAEWGSGWLETTLDERGAFLLCDVPTPSQVHVVATVGEHSTEATVTLPTGGRMETTVLTVDPGSGG